MTIDGCHDSAEGPHVDKRRSEHAERKDTQGSAPAMEHKAHEAWSRGSSREEAAFRDASRIEDTREFQGSSPT